MPDKEHGLITAIAIDLLPKRQQALMASERKRLINEYCVYPDMYFDLDGAGHAKARPYFFATNGVQFHYIPDTPVTDKYRCWQVVGGKIKPPRKKANLNWAHAKNGFEFYLTKSVAQLCAGRQQEALSFIGCLLHMLQDSTFGLHSLEGPYGTDLFVLDRLFDNDGDIDKLPSKIMVANIPKIAVTRPDYSPQQLGDSIPETVFRLYNRYVDTSLQARKLTFKIIQDNYAGHDSVETYKTMFHNAVRLCADVLYTVFCLAQGKHMANSDVILSDIEPNDRPWGASGHYRFVTILRDKALNHCGNIVPLQLMIAGAPVFFKKGLSFGGRAGIALSYEIPRNVYAKLTFHIGIYPDGLENSEAPIQITSAGKTVLNRVFDKNHPSMPVEINHPGGVLKIAIASRMRQSADAVIIWADPKLRKKQG